MTFLNSKIAIFKRKDPIKNWIILFKNKMREIYKMTFNNKITKFKKREVIVSSIKKKNRKKSTNKSRKAVIRKRKKEKEKIRSKLHPGLWEIGKQLMVYGMHFAWIVMVIFHKPGGRDMRNVKK